MRVGLRQSVEDLKRKIYSHQGRENSASRLLLDSMETSTLNCFLLHRFCQSPQSWGPIPLDKSLSISLSLSFWRTLTNIDRIFSEVICLYVVELGLTLGLTLQSRLFHFHLLPLYTGQIEGVPVREDLKAAFFIITNLSWTTSLKPCMDCVNQMSCIFTKSLFACAQQAEMLIL